MSGERIGVIADVHGNLPALEPVLAELDRAAVDRVLCAGDVVGYGPFPNECVARVRESAAACVAGNHDLMAIGRLEQGRPGGLVRETMDWTRGVLAPDSRAWLEDLPRSLTEEGLVMAHGSLGDPTVYVYADDAAEQLATVPPGTLMVLGHTHEPLSFGERRGIRLERRAGEVAIEAGERLLVNPGSVGQPREWRALARFAVIDLGAGVVRHRAIRYDEPRVKRALADAGLPSGACHRRPAVGWLIRRRLSRIRRSFVT
jgi:predicted phosphodiesterase